MRRLRFGVPAAIVALLAAGLAYSAVSNASEPQSSEVTVPGTPTPPTVVATWTGTIPPGSHPTNNCPLPDDPTQDTHDIVLTVPPGTYSAVTAQFVFEITWADPTLDDEILTVVDPNGVELQSSDGGTNVETVTLRDLGEGTYDVRACAFYSVVPPGAAYTGTLTLSTEDVDSEGDLPSADARGLAFSATVPADPQRDESEPLIESNLEGETWTCGPTGSSNGADYAQVSTDGNDQFHIIGTPPRGQQALGGGGDCAMAFSPVVNPVSGHSNYAYTGLNNLIEFSTATSPDGGRSVQSSAHSSSQPGLDRQWLTFLDENRVLLNYNQVATPLVVPPGRATVVQLSTDRGLNYAPPVVGANNPLFPGQLRTLPAEFNPDGAAAGPVAYFPWMTSTGALQLSFSRDGGASWLNCRLLEDPRGIQAGFTMADHDELGNIYVTYSDEVDYHTYLTIFTADLISQCDEPASIHSKKLVPSTTPVQVDRDDVRTSLFPWLAVGAPGRVAVTFYGTETQGNPNTAAFKATWNVFVNQSLNALSPSRTFSQVQATTHPFHYDSICLNGLACDTTDPGDRSLADFFAIDYNAVSGKLAVVYDQSAKLPDDAAGKVAMPGVVTQIAGPSLGGGFVTRDPRPVVRSSSVDPTLDAISSYSSLGGTGAQINEPASDFTSVEVGPEVDLTTGEPVTDGGFTVTMQVDDLTDESLNATMLSTTGQSLLWIFRFVNGYRASAAGVAWNPAEGFTFGYNDYATAGAECLGASNPEKCQVYRLNFRIDGTVDQETGTIRLSVPRSLLRALSGPTGHEQRPVEVPAEVGSRFYDATAFSFANTVSPVQSLQSFLYTLDNTPAFDFLLPEALPTLSIGDTTYHEGPHTPTAGLRISLSEPSTSPVRVRVTTSGGSATPGEDYVARDTFVKLKPGMIKQNFRVTMIDDEVAEPLETVIVTLSEPQGALIVDGVGVITIRADPVRSGPVPQ